MSMPRAGNMRRAAGGGSGGGGGLTAASCLKATQKPPPYSGPSRAPSAMLLGAQEGQWEGAGDRKLGVVDRRRQWWFNCKRLDCRLPMAIKGRPMHAPSKWAQPLMGSP